MGSTEDPNSLLAVTEDIFNLNQHEHLHFTAPNKLDVANTYWMDASKLNASWPKSN